MTEKTTIKRIGGNSMGIIFDKGVLEHVYGVKIGDEVQIDYKPPNKIIIIINN